MKSIHTNEFKAALFLIVATVLLIALSLKVSGTLDFLSRETYRIHARFSDVLGVPPEAKVTLLGVPVGRVVERNLVYEKDDTYVDLVLQLDKKTAQLYENATAAITSETLLSEKHVELWPGTKDKKKLDDGDAIVGAPAANVNAAITKADEILAALRDLVTDSEIRENIRSIFDQANGMLSDARRLIDDVDSTVNENREKLGGIFDRAKQIGDNVFELTEKIRKGLDEVQEDFQQILKDADDLINENRPGIQRTISEAEGTARQARLMIEESRKKLNRIGSRLEKVIKDVRSLSQQIDGTVSENRDDIERILDNLEKTTENAQDFFGQLADHPWRLVYPTEKSREVQTLYPEWKPADVQDQ